MNIILYGPDNKPLAPLAASLPPAPTRANQGGLTRTVETRLVRGFDNIIAAMPAVDEIIRAEGPDIYDRMRADDAVFAAEFQLMTRLLGRPWMITPPEHLQGDSFATEVADYASSALGALGVDAMLEHLYRALRYGHSGGQLVYRPDDATLVPSQFIPERRDVFRIGERGQLFVKIEGMFQPAESFRWMVHVNEPEPERPGGRSMLQRIYWPWKFKRTIWELSITAMDRFAVPSLAALFELAEADVGKAKEWAGILAEELLKIASGSVAALANVKDIKQIGGQTQMTGLDVPIELCERAIYRGILTTTLTVQEGKSGSERGDTSVHDRSADRVAEWYGLQLAETMTMTVVAYAVLLKYGEAARRVLPKFSLSFEGKTPKEDVLDFMDRGVPVSLRSLYSDYGAPEPGDPDDVFIARARVSPRSSGDGATASITFPAGDEESARARLFTLTRNREIRTSFEGLREEGLTVNEALDAIADVVNLSRGTVRNIAYGKPRS